MHFHNNTREEKNKSLNFCIIAKNTKMALEDYMLPCLNKKLFGIECFGCGSQRALLMVFQGDFVGAFKMFPAVYPMLFFFLFLALNFIDKKRNYSNIIIGLGIFTAIVMIVSYYLKYPIFRL